MSNFDETIGGVDFMVVGKNAIVVQADSEEFLDVDDVLKLAEFAAAAYEALTGGPYVHKEYQNGELEVRDGLPLVPEGVHGFARGGYVSPGAGPVLGGIAAGMTASVQISPETVRAMANMVRPNNLYSGLRFPAPRLERGA